MTVYQEKTFPMTNCKTLCGRFGFPIPKVPVSNFKISDMAAKDSVAIIVHIWNKGFQNIKELGQGGDWSTFFKVNRCGFIIIFHNVPSFRVLIKFIMFF
jgi:hypothetical protein